MTVKPIKFIYMLALLLISVSALHAEDYQYQYFNGGKDKYVPFSDYIPRVRLHYKTVPHYLEDYYELYGMKQYYNENSLRKNIARMKTALSCKFRHPSMALVRIESEQEYLKYRNLMFMHINLLIMRNYMKIASKYDMRKIRFYHADFADDIRDSLHTAEKYYGQALPYWQEAVKYARVASGIRITTDLSAIESERFSIIHGDLDYNRIIRGHMTRVRENRNKLSEASHARN